MANGYMGKILWVDLTSKNIKEEVLEETTYRLFVGGYGIGARLLFTRQKPGIDPLGPENILGFTTGPLTGTPALSGSRYIVVGKSPLTGGWGDANSGGFFGPKLKSSGFDAIFFTGQSEKPVYLYVDNEQFQIRDASHLWGKDSNETEDILKSELGKDIEIACIGPSGEKMSYIAAVINNRGRAAGRSGLGAVMGSKKLKAVVVRGNMQVPLAYKDKVSELRKTHQSSLGGLSGMLKEYGTPFMMIPFTEEGDATYKNFGGVGIEDFPHPERIGNESMKEYQIRSYGCYRCPIACGGHLKGGTDYDFEPGGHKPEYETLAMFGSNCLNDNLESVIKANDICNRYGIDTISAGAAISYAIECYENGLITKDDTNGIELTWGNHESIVAMTEKLAKREGFGDILADGVKVAVEKIGQISDEYAIHINGEEIPAHDPRCGLHFAVAYQMAPTPGRHTQGMGVCLPGLPVPEFDRQSMYGRGPAHKKMHCFNDFMQCTGACLFIVVSMPHISIFMDFLNTVTGWDIDFDELFLTGERITNIRHAYNIREGLNPLNFRVPGRILGHPPLQEGPLAGINIDEKTMISEYLTIMDWDQTTTKPSKNKLRELGLHDVAEVL